MSDFQRQHPVAAITRAVDLVRGNFVTIVVLMVVGASGSGGVTFAWWLAGLFLFLLVSGTAGWWRFVYRVEKGELQIRQGIFVRKNLFLTRDRIQVIDVTAGIIQRMFGLVSVEIKTAGSTSREASLSAVSRSEAHRLTDLLRNGELHGEGEEAEAAAVEQTRKTYHLPAKELLIAASTSGSFGIALSIIATIFSQIEPLISETELYEWFLAVIPSEADGTLILSLVAVFVLFAWLMSFFGTLLTYGDFTLTLEEDEMVIRRGIFEKKQITVPFNRIQAVRVVEGMLRQPFGYGTLYVESAGYGDQKGSGSVVIFPLMKSSEIELFLGEVLPGYRGTVKAEKPPLRAVTRYIIRSTLVLALVLAGVWGVLNASAWIWILLIPGIFWGWLRHHDAAVGVDQERIILSSRVLARTTAMVRKERAQDLHVSSSMIQRFRGFADLEVSVASGDQGRSFRIRDLEADTPERLLPWITKEHNVELSPDGAETPAKLVPGWG
ncbi:MAG: PH domain-containing protein [Balneolaceae bacterium]